MLTLLKAPVAASPMLHLVVAKLLKVPFAFVQQVRLDEYVHPAGFGRALRLVAIVLLQCSDLHSFPDVFRSLKKVQLGHVGICQPCNKNAPNPVAMLWNNSWIVGIKYAMTAVVMEHCWSEGMQPTNHPMGFAHSVANTEEDLLGHLSCSSVNGFVSYRPSNCHTNVPSVHVSAHRNCTDYRSKAENQRTIKESRLITTHIACLTPCQQGY